MSLIRFVGRAAFASFFVADGLERLTRPEQSAAALQPSLNTLLPRAKRILPNRVSDRIPTEALSWARILGAVEVSAGFAFGLNIGRRGAAVALAATLVPQVIAAAPAPLGQGEGDRAQFLRQVALLGGAVLASQDTQGHPSLGWWAAHSAELLARHSRLALHHRARLVSKDLALGRAKLQLAAERSVPGSR